MVYSVDNISSLLVIFGVFVVASPGIFMRLPKGGSKYIVAITHAAVFMLALFLIDQLFDTSEGYQDFKLPSTQQLAGSSTAEIDAMLNRANAEYTKDMNIGSADYAQASQAALSGSVDMGSSAAAGGIAAKAKGSSDMHKRAAAAFKGSYIAETSQATKDMGSYNMEINVANKWKGSANAEYERSKKLKGSGDYYTGSANKLASAIKVLKKYKK